MPLLLPCSDPQPLAPGLERTDAFHRQPLFAVQRGSEGRGARLVVRSWNEAHALHGPARPSDVDPAFVAALISDQQSASASPYRRIQRLPRSSHVLIGSDGEVVCSSYDPLAGGAAAMEPDTLHAFLRQGLLDHVRLALADHPGRIGCEHSSGLDSNAVLGALVHGAGVPAERLFTWSYEAGGEGAPLEEFRRFHRLLPSHCHRVDHPDAWFGHDEERLPLQLGVFGAPAQFGGSPPAMAWLKDQGCTLLFSGFGGDQALSHNANNVPTDLVAQARWRELHHWMGSRRAALKTSVGRALGLLWRPWAERRVLRRAGIFMQAGLLQRSLTAEGRAWLEPHLPPSYPWEMDGYLPQHASIRRRVLDDWVAVRVEEESRLAAAHGMEKVFPLLDERLIAMLLQQDPAHFGEGIRRGRLLHRRAFAPFLPPLLQHNPSKHRHPEEGLEQWQAAKLALDRRLAQHSLRAAADWHPALARWWSLDRICQEAERVLESSRATPPQVSVTRHALLVMMGLSGWWEALDA